MDDRFTSDSTVFKRPPVPLVTRNERDWDGAVTLEDSLRNAISFGRANELAALIRLLPEEKRERYREIWRASRSELTSELAEDSGVLR